MWLMTNKGFVSIVKDRDIKNNLMVRARIKGHIEAVFTGAKASYTENADYAYRASIPKSVVAQVMADLVDDVTYDNFKNSVKDDPLHKAYMDVWTVMYRYQQRFKAFKIKRSSLLRA